MKLVLIGAPAAGKGTQASRLVKKFNIAHISTGDMLRDQINKGTELGKQVQEVMAAGKLVSDELIIEIVKDRISQDDCKNGFILDGFPRTVNQAKKLDELIGAIDKAIYIKADDEVILKRLTARETCPKCGATYNRISLPSKKAGICDVCGTALTQRKDDTVEAGRSRLAAYHEQSEPLVDYYSKQDLVLAVDGLQAIDEVTKTIVDGLGERA
ncbi:MAG: adenylate kinase [Clostridiales bacterium]|nr:adenylate kinase [Clostridiales bacterium]